MDQWSFLDELCDVCRIEAELFKDWTAQPRCERCLSLSGLRVLAAPTPAGLPLAARGGPLAPRNGDDPVEVWVAS